MKREESFYASKSAIYEWLRSARGQLYCKHLYSKRYRKKRRIKKTQRVMIPNRVGIEHRPIGATNRSRLGHFEVDTIVSGKRGCGAISVLIDRKSRYVVLNKLQTLKPSEHATVLKQTLDMLPVRSVTFDNGIENKHHEPLNIPTFFCDPYSSWQKGSVENMNKMIRRYIPKGTDISKVDEHLIQNIGIILNNKPRRSLNYKTPLEVMFIH